MNKSVYTLAVAAILSLAGNINAAVTVGHTEDTTFGQFFDLSGNSLGSTGGASVGYFPSNAPADTAFGLTIKSWADLIARGYVDVRSITSATPDWNFPLPIGGSVTNIPLSSLPAGTQLYLIGFNIGSFNVANPLDSFVGSTQWAVTKDTAGLSPADFGTKNMLLSAVQASEVLVGTDNGVNVNLAAIPEPSSMILIGTGVLGLIGRRRRNSPAC